MKQLLAIFLAALIVSTDCRTLRRWSKRLISWNFGDPYRYLTKEQFRAVRSTVSEAFDKWAVALDGIVQFEEFEEEELADISVFFAKKNHSCYEDFDGKGGVVAHSMYPPFGVLHLDGDEDWYTRNWKSGSRFIDLRLVLIHEIGHTLGLRHSRRKISVMRKHYEKPKIGKYGIQLSKYDIRAIRRLYESK